MEPIIALLISLFGKGKPNPQPPPPPLPHSQKQATPVPEPTTIFGSAIAVSGFAYLRNKKKTKLAK
jgi:hypothetical protein